jgi:hypothetical protein
MGAEFRFYIYKGKEEDLGDYHTEFQREACYEGGTDTYAGHIGIMPDGINFANITPLKSYAQAEEYLEDNHSKWSSAMAVPFLGKKQDYDKTSLRTITQKAVAKQKLGALKETLLVQIKQAKSKTVGCRHCGSSVTRSFLSSLNCPVCDKSELLSATAKNRLLNSQQKINQLNKQKLKHIEANGTCYVVGGWCAA